MHSFKIPLPPTVNFECRKSLTSLSGRQFHTATPHSTDPGILSVSWTPTRLDLAAQNTLTQFDLTFTQGLLVTEDEPLMGTVICTFRIVMKQDGDAAYPYGSNVILSANTNNINDFRSVVESIKGLNLPLRITSNIRDLL
jgi:hypothetical protein